jgi:hypothetical protein
MGALRRRGMTVDDDDGAGSWRLKFATAVFCVLMGAIPVRPG